MDVFPRRGPVKAVSLANGLGDPNMQRSRTFCIAGTFAFFQALMPMIGWICVHTIVEYFKSFESWIPWIALALLGFIGGKMLLEGLRPSEDAEEKTEVGLTALLVQGVATSIDALSVGFTIAEYGVLQALLSATIIGVITFAISFGAVFIGKKFGTKLGDKAVILGGFVLIAIGIKIFVENVFFA